MACGTRPDENFVGINGLCPQVAAQICNARGSCCDEVQSSCEADEQRLCESELERLSQDGRLQYDASAAAGLLDGVRVDLARCLPPTPVAQLVRGQVPLGGDCEADGPEQAVLCGEGQCRGELAVCALDGACADSRQCPHGHYCAVGACAPSRSAGSECNEDAACEDGLCDAGLCAGRALCGQ